MSDHGMGDVPCEHRWMWRMTTHDRGSMYWVATYRCAECGATETRLKPYEEQ